jgi:hypothetical protein
MQLLVDELLRLTRLYEEVTIGWQAVRFVNNTR